MRRTAGLCGVTMIVAALACSSVAPVRINAGDQCFRCRRTISDTNMASERITGFVERFRGPGCMAKYIVAHPGENGPIFVTDYGSGEMFPPEQALFVPVTVDGVRGETDYRAYKEKAEAERVAADLRTTPVDWQTVLDRAKQEL